MLKWSQGVEEMGCEFATDAYIEGEAQNIYANMNPGVDPSLWLSVHQPLPNVWLGVSVEDQPTADARIPLLLQTPAAIRFVSYEPALGPADFARYLQPHWTPQHGADRPPWLDWIIAGGESGPGARPPHPDWFRSVRDQCVAAGVAFFFKQWGEYIGTHIFDPDRVEVRGDKYISVMKRVGKKKAGALLDGRAWKQFPLLVERSTPLAKTQSR